MRWLAASLSLLISGCVTLGSSVELAPPSSQATAAAPARALEPQQAAAEEYPPRAQAGAGSTTVRQRTRVISDAGAPGWKIREEVLDDKRYRLSLELDGLHTGGDGDVRRIVVRRAQALVRQYGFAGYEIVRLEQGVRSGWLWGKRVAEAELRLFESAAWPLL